MKRSKKIPSVVIYTKKNLTRMQAYEKLRWQFTDYRGFTYNPKTGRAVFT